MAANVFVYGTLKQGFCNNFYLRRGKFLGKTRTAPEFCLYQNDYYPMLVETHHKPRAIEGELYRVSNRAVERLDRLEGVDLPGFFERHEITLEDGRKCLAYVYVGRLDSLRRVEADAWNGNRRAV